MGKTLIIAEKPSVATDIARVLGGFTKHADYFESDQYVLSSAVGHLLELVVPEQYESNGEMELCQLTYYSAALRPQSHRENRGSTEAFNQTYQAQGR